MPYTNVGKDLMLNTLRDSLTEVSIHSSDPGTSGDNEIDPTGNTYVRASVTSIDFTISTGGQFALDVDLSFNGPVGGDCTFFGIWAGTDFVAYEEITGDTVFDDAGNFTLKNNTVIFNLNLVC
jgi:hypothetical protein